MPQKITNPLTGRKITVGGAAHKKLKLQLSKSATQKGGATSPPSKELKVRVFDPSVIQQQSDKFFDNLAKEQSTSKPLPTKLAASTEADSPVVPKNKNILISSKLPPAPAQAHSYYHHHAPFSQSFGDYVCVKKETLRDLGVFLRDSMFSSVDD
jgi:hypothetical protein